MSNNRLGPGLRGLETLSLSLTNLNINNNAVEDLSALKTCQALQTLFAVVAPLTSQLFPPESDPLPRAACPPRRATGSGMCDRCGSAEHSHRRLTPPCDTAP